MGDRDPGALKINTRHTPGLVCLLSPKSCQWRTLEPYTPNPGRGALKNTLFSKTNQNSPKRAVVPSTSLRGAASRTLQNFGQDFTTEPL